MNASSNKKAFKRRQIKLKTAGIIALIGMTMAVVAAGAASDYTQVAEQVIHAVSHGPVGDMVHSMHII